MFLQSLRYISYVLKYRKNSLLSREQLLVFQKKEWFKLLKHIQKKSPYYSEIIQKINLPLEQITPEHFPVLTQKDLDLNFDHIVTDPKIKLKSVIQHAENNTPDKLYLDQYYIMRTSGTSGTPHYFVATTKDILNSIAPSVARSPEGSKKSKEKRRICMLGLKNSYTSANQNLNITNQLWIAKKFVDYRLISMDQPFENIVQELNQFQPHSVSGYAKLLLLLADAQRQGALQIHPESLESGGEPLLKTDRKYLKDVFKCAVNNHYGSTEGSSMGICRDDEEDMELFEDHIIFEIKKDMVYITNLHNYTLPLIRFQMNDVLVPTEKQTFTPFLKVETGVGRPEGIAYFSTSENGKISIQPMEVDPLFPEGVKTFSIKCERPNHILFILFLDEKYQEQSPTIIEKSITALKNYFKERNLNQVEIEIQISKDYKINPNSLKTQLFQNS